MDAEGTQRRVYRGAPVPVLPGTKLGYMFIMFSIMYI